MQSCLRWALGVAEAVTHASSRQTHQLAMGQARFVVLALVRVVLLWAWRPWRRNHEAVKT
jgi:membrane protein implicated in regulation of membrane protease activity